MPTYLFKYNPGGTPESGATQMKTLQYATGGINLSTGGWYSGVSDLGVYLITSDTTTTGLAGRSTGNGTGTAPAGVPTFWRTAGTSESQLLSVVNRLPGSPGNFATAAGATAWLNSNNYGLFTSTSGVTFSQVFVNATAPTSAVETAWNTFRSSLTGSSYTQFVWSSTNGSSITVSDSTKVQLIATALKNGTTTSQTIGGNTWLVGVGCGTPKIGGVAVELSNVASCNAGSTYALRPMINNSNWGGTNGTTVNAPSQTITLTFS